MVNVPGGGTAPSVPKMKRPSCAGWARFRPNCWAFGRDLPRAGPPPTWRAVTLATSAEKFGDLLRDRFVVDLDPGPPGRPASIALTRPGRVGPPGHRRSIRDLGCRVLHDVIRVPADPARCLSNTTRKERRVLACGQRHGGRRPRVMKAIPARPPWGPPTARDFPGCRPGPATATMLEFEMNCWVTVVACAGCNCVFALDERDLGLVGRVVHRQRELREVQLLGAGGVPPGPVIGALEPDRRGARLGAGGAAGGSAAPRCCYCCYCNQPRRASQTAAAARTRRPFMGYASIPGKNSRCRNHGARPPRGGLAIRRQIGRPGGGPAPRRPRSTTLNTPSPIGRIRNADQTIAVYVKARGPTVEERGRQL